MSETIELDLKHLPPSAVVAGLRRIEYVRVVVGTASPLAFVSGIARRYPREYRISLATAVALADRGVPVRLDLRP